MIPFFSSVLRIDSFYLQEVGLFFLVTRCEWCDHADLSLLDRAVFVSDQADRLFHQMLCIRQSTQQLFNKQRLG